jgi:hypothetical protein
MAALGALAFPKPTYPENVVPLRGLQRPVAHGNREAETDRLSFLPCRGKTAMLALLRSLLSCSWRLSQRSLNSEPDWRLLRRAFVQELDPVVAIPAARLPGGRCALERGNAKILFYLYFFVE